uniref:Uncharacterized protein n=1 Tax=Octopus bimaculoides TaxID=37653 RepID=A0A0L8FWY2_OCTBM
MSRYTNVRVDISEEQKQKLQNDQTGGPVSIYLGYLNGADTLALTKSQVNKLVKAYESGKGITIKMSKLLYLKKESGLYDSEGLLLGANSQQNIPILGMILKAPPLGGEQSYRLQKVPEIQQILHDESEKQQNLRKKYRAIKVISKVDFALSSVSMGLGVFGAGLLSTIVTAPIVIVMELTALETELQSIIGGQINKRTMQKVGKHEKVKMLAEAKLNTISDFISKALTVNKVSV